MAAPKHEPITIAFRVMDNSSLGLEVLQYLSYLNYPSPIIKPTESTSSIFGNQRRHLEYISVILCVKDDNENRRRKSRVT